MQAQEAERSGRLVIAAQNVSFGYGERPLERPVVRDLSLTLTRGDKIGLIGPNGCGKTTLLKLLLGELKPQAGAVRHGTNLEVSYFDQLRAQIVEEKTVQDNVAGGSDHVLVGGQRQHIIGYLHDFLFSSERARSPARSLSGGERNRLLLAKLFTKPSNVLVLDEPTNDLDTETLELLENLLVDYGGTVLLVSHDRAFLDNVTTSVLAFEGDGVFREYDGGYDDWRRAAERAAKAGSDAERAEESKRPAEKPRPRSDKSRKLSYKEERELESLPQRIEQLEAEQAALHEAMLDPDFFRQGGAEIAAVTARLEAIAAELHTAYERWESLEALREAGATGD
jgi:ATP-binding cassette subfamily F protein uup